MNEAARYGVGAGGSDGGGADGSVGVAGSADSAGAATDAGGGSLTATATGCCASGMMGAVTGAGSGVTSPFVVSIVLSPS